MKKAKTPNDLLSKASDFLSVLKNFAGDKKDKNKESENISPLPEEKNKKTDNDSVNKQTPETSDTPKYDIPEGVPSFIPSSYGTKMFEKVIEDHDRRVKNIIKSTKKDNS